MGNSKRVVGVVEFQKTFTEMLKQYTDGFIEGMNEEIKDTSNAGADMLKKTTYPSASKSGSAKPIKRRTWKKYANSWSSDVRQGTNFIHTAIRNKKHYQLTHLLEYGHITRNGTHTREFRHIEPVEIYCDERITKNIPKIIQKGGKL